MKNKFVYIVTETFDSTEKNYEIGTYINSVFLNKKDALKRVSELEKENYDDCVEVIRQIERKKLK